MEAFIGIYLGELVFRLDFRLEQRVEHQARPAGRAESGQVLVCKPWSVPPAPCPPSSLNHQRSICERDRRLGLTVKFFCGLM